MEFKIGDRVAVKEYSQIPEEHRSTAIGRLCGEIGTVTDRLYSEGNGGYTYRIQFDSYERPSNKLWMEEQIERYVEPVTTYRYDFEYLDTVVVARLYEVCGDTETLIEMGHGHIFHDGALGIAQAASYALKKLYEKMNGGVI